MSEEKGATEAEVAAAEEVERRPIIITASSRFRRSRGDELCVTNRTDVVKVNRFKTKPAVVKRGFGVTISQGEYEFVRVDVSVEVPCYLSDIALADKWAAKFCEDRLREEVLSIQSGDDGIDDDHGTGSSTSVKSDESPL